MMLGLRSVAKGQGGVEAHVDQLTQEFDRAGLTVEIVVRTPYSGKARTERGLATRIVPIWSPVRQSLEAFIHSALGVWYAARARPRILHIHAVGPSLVAPLARLAGLAVVTTHHGEDYNREKWGPIARTMLRLGEWSAARFSNARIVVSSSLALQLGSKYGVEFHYVPNGVRLPTPVGTRFSLEEWGLDPGRYLLSVGRIVPEKRQLDLIKAFADLAVPDAKLVIAGAADHASEYSREVSRMAAETPGVIMVGFVTGQPLAELYSNAGLFVLPSSHEGLPIALLEAMAYGNRVLASDIDANLNVGLPAECHFPLGDLAALTEALHEWLAKCEPGARADWSQLLAGYDWTDIAQRTLAIYRSAAELNAMPLPGPRHSRPVTGRE
jgi:glycosyltransferase involved in cell wall biosynthesis